MLLVCAVKEEVASERPVNYSNDLISPCLISQPSKCHATWSNYLYYICTYMVKKKEKRKKKKEKPHDAMLEQRNRHDNPN